MALIECNECGKHISDKAAFCPNCGLPSENNNIEEDIKQELNAKQKIHKADNLSTLVDEILNIASNISENDRNSIKLVGDKSISDCLDDIKYIASDRKYSSLIQRIDAANRFKSNLIEVLCNTGHIKRKPPEPVTPEQDNFAEDNNTGVSIYDYDKQSRKSNSVEINEPSSSTIVREDSQSAIGTILYRVSAVPMFIFFMYHGMKANGDLLAICIFPWYMLKAVLWPLFLFCHWY